MGEGEEMRRTVYEMIFARLQQMGIIDESGKMQADYMKFISSGLMPLNVDKLTYDTIALAHNGKQNGDVMADPDMEVRIYPEMKMAEALTFRNDYMGDLSRSISRAWEILSETQEGAQRLSEQLA